MLRLEPWVGLAMVLVTLASAPESVWADAAHEAEPAEVEAIAGTGLSRLILTPDAIARLGIETIALREESIERKRVVAGRVLQPGEAPVLGLAPPDDVAVVRVAVAGDVQLVARDRPALVRALADGGPSGLPATPMATPALPGAAPTAIASEQSEEALYYSVVDSHHVLKPGQHVLVELSLGIALRKMVPTSAVFFGSDGSTWVYTSPEPRSFVRHKIDVAYIDGPQAALVNGPPPGTMVVTVGASLLFGVEFEVDEGGQ